MSVYVDMYEMEFPLLGAAILFVMNVHSKELKDPYNTDKSGLHCRPKMYKKLSQRRETARARCQLIKSHLGSPATDE